MKLKTATLLALIGVILGMCLVFFNFLVDLDVVDYKLYEKLRWPFRFISFFYDAGLIIFLYTLYKKQK